MKPHPYNGSNHHPSSPTLKLRRQVCKGDPGGVTGVVAIRASAGKFNLGDAVDVVVTVVVGEPFADKLGALDGRCSPCCGEVRKAAQSTRGIAARTSLRSGKLTRAHVSLEADADSPPPVPERTPSYVQSAVGTSVHVAQSQQLSPMPLQSHSSPFCMQLNVREEKKKG